jgi:hypothetical protein
MWRLAACCISSILIYLVSFAFILDRPLSLGTLNLEIQEKTARLMALPSPKLVILAGSNGPYSHSCFVIGIMLNLPCENAGIAVGIGLDQIFARYEPALRRGDIVYMPMEISQYVVTEAQNNAGVDGAQLLRYDRSFLSTLPPERILGAVFSSTILDFLDAIVEMSINHITKFSSNNLLANEYNLEGDRTGTSLALADEQLLFVAQRREPGTGDIIHGFGAQLVGRFVEKESVKGVIILGGLPTDFNTVKLPHTTIAAIQSIYESHDARFVALKNLR